MTRLEKLRLDARMTPEQLGEAAGVAGGTIRRLEAGKGARIATLGKLADFFEIAPSELLADVAPAREAA